jgi:hypothetical protein
VEPVEGAPDPAHPSIRDLDAPAVDALAQDARQRAGDAGRFELPWAWLPATALSAAAMAWFVTRRAELVALVRLAARPAARAPPFVT